MASIFLLKEGTAGHVTRSRHFVSPTPALIPYGIIAMSVGAVLLACSLFGFDCFYVVHLEHRWLYHRFKFFWLRRLRLALRNDEIAALTVEGKRVSSRYSGPRWLHRVVAVDTKGSWTPLGDWRRGLGQCNAEAAELAEKLDVGFQAAPPASRLEVLSGPQGPIASFVPGERPTSLAVVSILVIVVVTIVWVLAAAFRR